MKDEYYTIRINQEELQDLSDVGMLIDEITEKPGTTTIRHALSMSVLMAKVKLMEIISEKRNKGKAKT